LSDLTDDDLVSIIVKALREFVGQQLWILIGLAIAAWVLQHVGPVLS
jgi:hypothetical protein